MISFLKSFLMGEKTADEKELMAQQSSDKKRDYINLDSTAENDNTGGGCQTGGCGGCGCR